MRKVLLTGVCLSIMSFDAIAAETVTYTYDEHGRLVKVQKVAGPQVNAKSEYEYDKAGNRIRRLETPPS